MIGKVNAMDREQLRAEAREALRGGKDLAEVLDRQGFLLTPQRLMEIQARTLEEIAEVLATSTPRQWTRRDTQQDLMDAIVRNLREIANGRRQDSAR